MRAVVLATLLLVGCTASPAASTDLAPSASASPAAIASATASAAPSTAAPTGSSPASPEGDGSYTADDAQIALLIRAGAEDAIPQLKGLNDSDPSKLERLFEPLGIWIASQKSDVAAYVASSCTADAVARFTEGLDRYDAIRKKFLAWRDWGALGNAFPPGAPREAGDSFREALAELEAHCAA
jgi:hypothetical protein